MRRIVIFYLIIAFVSCTQGKKAEKEQKVEGDEAPIYSLDLVWASDTLLRTPESVCFDKQRKVLYISNVNLNPWEKDGDGFISKMDLSGNIIELEWVKGLHGPKGMGVLNGSLYTADIDEIVEINIVTGEISKRFKVDGNPNLNDITVGEDGTVYVTGSSSNKIYALKNGEVTEFLAGGDESFNGLYWEKDKLLLITSGSSQFKAIDWDTKSVSIISENMGAGDGIVCVGEDTYLTSSWAGAIFLVASDGTTTKLLDTEAENMNTADFDYSLEDNLLFVPTFFDNRIMAYELVF